MCAVNARAAFDNPRTALIPSVELMVDDYTSGALIERVWTRHHGVLDHQPDPIEP